MSSKRLQYKLEIKLKAICIDPWWETRGEGHRIGNRDNGINLTFLKQIFKGGEEAAFPYSLQSMNWVFYVS